MSFGSSLGLRFRILDSRVWFSKDSMSFGAHKGFDEGFLGAYKGFIMRCMGFLEFGYLVEGNGSCNKSPTMWVCIRTHELPNPEPYKV